jgi:ubiquinone/menaquinone biosynthesis C-methylase UbiE
LSILEILWYLLLALLAVFLVFGILARIIRRVYHFPTPSLVAGLLDNPIRRKVQSPRKIADRLDLRDGMKVLEVGPGPGTFTIEVGTRVAPRGAVYALDISSKTIRKLLNRIVKTAANNVMPVVASAYDVPLASRSVDRVFMVAVLAEIPDRQRALREFARILRPDGFISISEFISDPDYPLRRTVIQWCNAAGFQEVSKYGSLVEYTLTFRQGEGCA